MNYVLIGIIIFAITCIICCLCSSIIGGYIWYNKSTTIETAPTIPITLASDPNLLYNYVININDGTNTKILMSGKVSSQTFINNINTALVANNITNIVATIVPTINTNVIEHYKITTDTTYYLTTDNENMLYVLMLILPDYTPLVYTVINTKETSPITITPGMKSVSLAKLKSF